MELPENQIVREMVKDILPNTPKNIVLPPDKAIDKRFRSWGGFPEKVDNWQAIALTAIETMSKTLLMMQKRDYVKPTEK
jgi:hypothetical protein